MKQNTPFVLSREKHLDHMVKVVPLIVLGFAIQSYVLMSMKNSLGINSVFVLGACLCAMIGAFIIHDIKHVVTFHSDFLESKFLFFSHKVFYKDISGISISDPKQSFATLRFKANGKKHTYFFIDDAEEIKSFIEAAQAPVSKSQAA